MCVNRNTDFRISQKTVSPFQKAKPWSLSIYFLSLSDHFTLITNKTFNLITVKLQLGRLSLSVWAAEIDSAMGKALVKVKACRQEQPAPLLVTVFYQRPLRQQGFHLWQWEDTIFQKDNALETNDRTFSLQRIWALKSSLSAGLMVSLRGCWLVVEKKIHSYSFQLGEQGKSSVGEIFFLSCYRNTFKKDFFCYFWKHAIGTDI